MSFFTKFVTLASLAAASVPAKVSDLEECVAGGQSNTCHDLSDKWSKTNSWTCRACFNIRVHYNMRSISRQWANNFNARRSSVVIALTSRVSFDKVAAPIDGRAESIIELGYDADGNYLFRLEFQNSFNPGNDEVDFNIEYQEREGSASVAYIWSCDCRDSAAREIEETTTISSTTSPTTTTTPTTTSITTTTTSLSTKSKNEDGIPCSDIYQVFPDSADVSGSWNCENNTDELRRWRCNFVCDDLYNTKATTVCIKNHKMLEEGDDVFVWTDIRRGRFDCNSCSVPAAYEQFTINPLEDGSVPELVCSLNTEKNSHIRTCKLNCPAGMTSKHELKCRNNGGWRMSRGGAKSRVSRTLFCK
ncbi:Oidioi.mRNA.OKI2018_I69.PAR.g10246.t1.cds [Oikopleura dioica]|uniref:Oidioi.mRNA.OKI2018_I69.PAR.g10246.t1.cds n=1 Tax=Oikopleura dioica TaxID=34765 RepID=A0ABN7RPQ6_OIKDI|nr:Oidioi.mRNA.OKI2018_I69.PAR.g10246.t1.cds [Oikopleura dioica]